MKQYALLAFLSPVASLLAVTGPAQSEKLKTKTNPQKQPNVIFIYADDLGYGDLECYGAKNVQTPHVNQLAESGVQFTNAHATAATSTPSRYSMLTGKYAWRVPGTGVAAGNAGMIIRPETYTLADVFKNSGYITGAIGKWHLGWVTNRACKTGMLHYLQHWETWDLIIPILWQPQRIAYHACLLKTVK